MQNKSNGTSHSHLNALLWSIAIGVICFAAHILICEGSDARPALIGLILTVALLVSLILIFGECQRTYAVYSEQNAISSHAASGGAGSFFIALLSPASIICIIVFIAAIII